MYKKNNSELLKHFDFLLGDIIILQLSFYQILCMYRRGHLYGKEKFGLTALVFLAAILIVTVATEPYKSILKRGWFKELTETLKFTFFIAMVAILCFYLWRTRELLNMRRPIIALTMVCFFVYSYIFHQVWKYFVRLRISRQSVLRSMVVFTDEEHVEEVLSHLEGAALKEYTVSKVFLMDYQEKNRKYYQKELDARIFGDARDMIDYSLHGHVDEVFFYLPGHQNDAAWVYRDFADMGIPIHDAIGVIRSSSMKQIPEKMGGYLVSTTAINIVPAGYVILKRLLDIIGGLVGCAITGILCIFVGPAIYKADPGPIFYSQERIGKGGSRFKMYKFRSMYQDADKRKAELMDQNEMKDGLMFKMKDDPRVIGSEKKDKNGNPKGIGNFIRKTSIDEFPQFWNVLKGDMSLVGVRPPLVSEWENYELHHRARISARPGLTGLWQVSGRSDIKDFEDVVNLDLEYLQNWTPGLDVKIILKTIGLLFTHKGAE